MAPTPDRQANARSRNRAWAGLTAFAVVAGAMFTMLSGSSSPAQQPTRNLAVGVYRGPGPWGAALIGQYEQQMGPVDVVLDYQDVDTWENQEWPSWQAEAWQQQKRTVVLGGSGIFPVGGSWAAAARGDYDKHWRTLGERLVVTGQSRATLRGAHEFNGDWFHYKVKQDETQSFVTAWRRWVDIMRSVKGQQFTFDWNPIVGVEQLRHPEDAYPGDQWVDRVALDVYDGYYERGWNPSTDSPPTDAERDAVWDKLLNGERGLLFWKGFALDHAKAMSIPEWGLRDWTESDRMSHGGGDNPVFIERMHAIITDPGWHIAYHAPWEDPGYGLVDPDNHPKRVHSVKDALARYLSYSWRSGPVERAAPTSASSPTTRTAPPGESAAVPSRAVRSARSDPRGDRLSLPGTDPEARETH